MPDNNNQKPSVDALKLNEFFQSTYSVPKYQRYFTWGDREVSQLVGDLVSFHLSGDPYYLLGEVILSNSIDDQYDYDIIDGQQRTTTLLLFFAVCRRKVAEMMSSVPLDDSLSFLHDSLGTVLRTGMDKLRLRMSGDGSKTTLQYIKSETTFEQLTRSQQSILAAIETIEGRLTEEFSDTSATREFTAFVSNILNKAYVTRLTIADEAKAYDFFERVNNRGQDLAGTDLLKNRLFQTLSSDEDFDTASEVWESADRLLKPFGRLGSMDVLLRFILQGELGVKVKDKDLYYRWQEQLHGSVNESKLLVAKIQETAPIMANILGGKSPEGVADSNSQGTEFFKFTQNLCVKLAARHFVPVAYDNLAKRLEARAMLSILANERSQQYENLVPQWSKNISLLPSNPTSEELTIALGMSETSVGDLFAIARVLVKSLEKDSKIGATRRIRYILAKAAYEVNLGISEQNFTVKDFLTTSRTQGAALLFDGFDIDHIYASKISNLDEETNRLGNLVLLKYSENRSLQDAEPAEKTLHYGHSAILLNRALSRSVQQPPNIEVAIKAYRTASVDEEWNIESVTNRKEMYLQIIEGAMRRDLGPLVQ